MKPHKIIFFTSGQLMVFSKGGKQITRYQKLFADSKQNRKLLYEIALLAKEFGIAKWAEWIKELTKGEFIKLLNLKGD